jgi:ATP-dependent DNA helicase RecG
MSESQNIEYKSSWHEDYLDWICGFANMQLSESGLTELKD